MAVTQKQITDLRTADAALGDRIDKEVNARVVGDTALDARIDTLEAQVKLLLVSGGSGGGGTAPGTPNPPPTPPLPPVISNFTISSVTGTAATFACDTDVATTVIFDYWLIPGSVTSTSATASGTSHLKTATGLTAGRTYSVQARAGTSLSSVRTFSTPAAPPPGGETVAYFPGSGSNSPTAFRDLLVAASSGVYRYDRIKIQQTGGPYPWNFVLLNPNRTSRPLAITPDDGETVTFSYTSLSSGAFVTCDPTGVNYARYVTLDGIIPGGFTFDGYVLAQAGLFAVFGSSHLTVRNYKVQNIKRGVVSGGDPIKSYAGAYISSPYAGRANDHVTFDEGVLLAPTVNRDVSAYQVASHSATHSDIAITNQVMTGYALAWWDDRPITNLTLDEWDVNDCGQVSSGLSMRTVAAGTTGTYSNIDLTTSLGWANASAGFVSGGGNSF